MKVVLLSLLLGGLVGCGNNFIAFQKTSVPDYRIHGESVRPGVQNTDGHVSVVDAVMGDLNGDGRQDKAVILRLDAAGSGVFYYLNGFIYSESDGWQFAGEAFLGDRIRPDLLTIYAEGSSSPVTGVAIHPHDYGQLLVAFYTYTLAQSFVEEPKLYITKHWKVEAGKLQLVEGY